MVSKGQRILRHLFIPAWWVRRPYTSAVLDAVEAAVGAAEARHRGEIRIAIESAIDVRAVLDDEPVRARALAAFASLGVWDTADNSGVLLYISPIEHQVEIVADRGVAARVQPEEWQAICTALAAALARDEQRAGLVTAVEQVGVLLAQHFPADAEAADVDELPNRPVFM